MCTVCGCGSGEVTFDEHGAQGANGHRHHHDHPHADGHAHGHSHEHGHADEHVHPHAHDDAHSRAREHTDARPHTHVIETAAAHVHVAGAGHHHYGRGPAHAHAPGLSQARMVEIEENILGKNNQYAARNRERLHASGILTLNFVSSPGSGKTTLLAKTIEALDGELPVSVIEGDQQTSNDAERIRATGATALQVNTGKGCHLDGHMVGHAIDSLSPDADSLLFIENVGNLVCPASFDLGEDHKVVILSVTEGEDKPLKYPDMFHAADLMLLNKTDLLPHLDFDVAQCIANARRVNPEIRVLQLSARTGEGMAQWLDWIRTARQFARIGR